ncbi:4-coumarate--CoA ligase 1-like [Thrips palmi]|uniref:Luciferin 4-monooxygenase n=1 Tax=Thrips palmi TaxID=161013 RepID=A0A6P9A161_THRPL|nr:4-coumarate--CoA ligase 1-like [Thrips palmi]
MADPNVIHGRALDPIPNISLGEFLLSKLQSKGNSVAQVDIVTGETLTYPQILAKSINIAEYMRELGIRSGDIVCISSENNLDYCLPVLATLYIGATCAPLNPAYTEGELVHAMSISKPRIVFASALTISRVVGAVEKIDSVRDIVLIGRQTPGPLPCTVRLLSDFISQRMANNQLFIPARVNPERDPCLILCSSGTTGLPKGVELTSRNFLQFVFVTNSGGLPDTECILGLMPFYHGYGFGLLTVAIMRGGTVIVFPRFEEELFLRAVQDYKISTLFVVPPLMVFLGKHPIVDKYNLSSVKTIICGAAPLDKDTQLAVSQRLGVKDIRQGYGMTETSILATSYTDGVPVKMGSSGRVVTGMSAKIVDVETGNSLPRNKEGEICFKGNMVMKGYRNNIEATKSTIDQDGWLHTGDIGYFDDDGDLFVVDRIKELIKYKGFQVAPAELEAILYTNKAVRDACVVGKPDTMSGEVPVAFVVLQANAKASEKEIVDYVNERVSAQKKLRGGVRFVSEIPRNPSGKLLRRILRSKL